MLSWVRTLCFVLTSLCLQLTPNNTPLNKVRESALWAWLWVKSCIPLLEGHCLSAWKNLKIAITCQISLSPRPISDSRAMSPWERTIVWFASSISRFLFFSPSECTRLEASRREAFYFSRLNALAPVNILSPASHWDEQTDTNHCVDARKE